MGGSSKPRSWASTTNGPGQVLKAVIVVADGEILTEDDVKKLVTGRLARFKVPKIIEFTDALPRTATGKLLRRKMI